MKKLISNQLFFAWIILALLSACSGLPTAQIPTEAPPAAIQAPTKAPTTAPALPIATSISLPTATTAPALPTATSIPLPTATIAPALPTATSIPLPSPTNATTATPSTTTSAAQGQIVFQVYQGNNRNQIYIEQADGSNLRQLVKSDFNDGYPFLSPDGKTVFFTRDIPDQGGVFVVNVDGTHLHQLNAGGCVKPCLGLGAEGHPWSPDGKQIIYNRAVANADGSCCVEVGWWVMKADGSGAHHLSVMKADGSGAQLIWEMKPASEDHFVGWSPDGKRFVFMRIDNTASPVHSAIFTMATGGSDPKQVTPWELNAGQPAWSPDGKLIAFCAPSCDWFTGETNIYTIHPDGTGLTQLTSHLQATDQGNTVTDSPSWSPDGSQIVFAHGPVSGGFFGLFVMNRDGSGLHFLGNGDHNEDYPNWGPSPAP